MNEFVNNTMNDDTQNDDMAMSIAAPLGTPPRDSLAAIVDFGIEAGIDAIKSEPHRNGQFPNLPKWLNRRFALTNGQEILTQINISVTTRNKTLTKVGGEKPYPTVSILPANAIAAILKETGDFQILKTDFGDGEKLIYKKYMPDGSFSGISLIVDTTSKELKSNVIATVIQNLTGTLNRRLLDDVMMNLFSMLANGDTDCYDVYTNDDIVENVGSNKTQYVVYPNNKYYLVCCNNGIYNMNDRTFTPHNSPDRWTKYPDVVFLNKLGTDFVENATCPKIVQPDGTDWTPDIFFKSLFDQSTEVGQASARMMWELTQLSVRQYSGAEGSMAMFINASGAAGGHNGKSTASMLISNIIRGGNQSRRNNVQNGEKVLQIQIQKWGKDFKLGKAVETAMMLISDEGDGDSIQGMDIIKNIARANELQFDVKHKDAFSFAIHFMCIHMQNGPIKFSTSDLASFTHILWLAFDQDFTNGNKLIINDYIYRPEVLEYMLWYVLTQMPILDEFTPSDMKLLEVNADAAKRANIPVYDYLDEVLPMFHLLKVPINWLYEIYKDVWQYKNGIKYTPKLSTFKGHVEQYVVESKGKYIYDQTKGANGRIKKQVFSAEDKDRILHNTHPAMTEYGTLPSGRHVSFARMEFNGVYGAVKEGFIDSKFGKEYQIASGCIAKTYPDWEDEA